MSNNLVITIGREFGSGGHEVGARLAKRLGIDFYDKELIDIAAEKSGCSEHFIRRNDERTPGIFARSVMFTKGNAYSHMSPEDDLFIHQTAIIKELGEKGPCVIVGRCADYVLREKRNVVKVFIHAPLDDRIRRKMALGTEGSTEKEVKKNILTKEKVRERYYNFYTGSRWGDSRNYNLCIDTSKVGIDGAVEIIAAYVEHERQHSILPD